MVGCRTTRDTLWVDGTCVCSSQMFFCTFCTVFRADALITYVPIFLAFIATDGFLDVLADNYVCTVFRADALIMYVPIFLAFIATDGFLDVLADNYVCI